MQIPAQQLVYTHEDAYRVTLDGFTKRFREYREDFDQICLSWPNMEAILQRACFLVSPGYRSAASSAPLLEVALRNATLAGMKVVGDEAFEPFMLAFLNTLAAPFAQYDLFGLAEDGHQARWHLHDAPLCQWATGFDRIVFEVRGSVLGQARKERATALLLAARILNDHEMGLLLPEEPQDAAIPPQLSSPSAPPSGAPPDRGSPAALSELSEFSGRPGWGCGARVARRAGAAGCVSLGTFLSHHKKVPRPPGRDPAMPIDYSTSPA